MLAPDASTLSTCVTDGRPDGSLLHSIVFGGSGNDCFHLLAPVTSHRHVFCNSAVEHLLVLAVQQAVVGGIEGQPFPIYDHVEPIVQQGVARGWIYKPSDDQRRIMRHVPPLNAECVIGAPAPHGPSANTDASDLLELKRT
jgi:hypothetical protein